MFTEHIAEFGGGPDKVHDGDDPNTTIVFSMIQLENPAKTEAEGRLVVDDVEVYYKLVPGDALNRPVHPVTDEIRRKHAHAYKTWKANQSEDRFSGGFPLKEWPVISKRQVMEMEALNIFTVENLVACPDAHLSRVPYARELQQKAQRWLAGGQNMTAKVDELQAQIAELQAQLAASSADRRGPGRPPKVAREGLEGALP